MYLNPYRIIILQNNKKVYLKYSGQFVGKLHYLSCIHIVSYCQLKPI